MAPPPVTHIKWTLVINPDEVKCWLAVVRPFLDMLAGLSDFAGCVLVAGSQSLPARPAMSTPAWPWT